MDNLTSGIQKNPDNYLAEKQTQMLIEQGNKKLKADIDAIKEQLQKMNEILLVLQQLIVDNKRKEINEKIISNFNSNEKEIQQIEQATIQKSPIAQPVLNNQSNEQRQDFSQPFVQGLQPNARKNVMQSTNPNQNEKIKPRTGDYTPDNVSIDQFFYFGNKKK